MHRFAVLFLPVLLCAQAQTPPAAPKAATAPKSAPAKSAPAKTGPARPAATAPKQAVPAPALLATDDQKTIYALGLSVYRQLSGFNLSPAELDIVKRALSDAAAGKPAVELNEWGPKIDPLGRARVKAASEAYLAKAAAEPGAVRTESGIVYREIRPGTGAAPGSPTDTVKVNYRGTLVSGTEFDSSYKRNAPAEFALNRVIRCWTEGVQKMKVGGKSMLVCPADLAYGEQGRPGIPGGAALIFEIELLEVNKAPQQ